jgi:hypothetical protein
MTLRQTIQAAPAKTTELITKLSATSNQALKTREGLFAQLGDELTRYVEIEERHFLPLLRKHPETKGLAADALKGNKELRASLEKLSAMPKDDDGFLAELDVLNKSFQQHVRNERKELLPAVLKALSDEEAGAWRPTSKTPSHRLKKRSVTRSGKRPLRPSVRRKKPSRPSARLKRPRRPSARPSGPSARSKKPSRPSARLKRRRRLSARPRKPEQAAAAERAADRARKAAERTAREATEQAVDTMARGAASVQDGAAQVTARIQERTRQVASDTQEAMNVYGHSSRKILDDLKAVKASSSVSAGAASEIYSAWFEWFGDAARANAEASQQLMQCRTVQQVAELQREFVTGSLRSWMERNAKVLEIAQRTSKQALGPLDGRLSEVA